MENHPWQQTAREAGLSQSILARLAGVTAVAVSRGLRARHKGGIVPRYLRALIIAWKIMTPEQRKQWLAMVDDTDSENRP